MIILCTSTETEVDIPTYHCLTKRQNTYNIILGTKEKKIIYFLILYSFIDKL